VVEVRNTRLLEVCVGNNVGVTVGDGAGVPVKGPGSGIFVGLARNSVTFGFGTLLIGPDIGLEIGPDIGSFNFAPTISKSLFMAKSLFALNNEAKA
jgi:hypothetical protein